MFVELKGKTNSKLIKLSDTIQDRKDNFGKVLESMKIKQAEVNENPSGRLE